MSQNKKLYVGSLPYSITEEELHSLFSEHGQVESVRIITDKFTGQSKGFGFVEMISGEEAEKATQALNGAVIKGRTLVVNEARPEERRERPAHAHNGAGGFRDRGDRDRNRRR